jgi:hypothetical protein
MRIIKRILIACSCFLTTSSLIAQATDFKLSDYKYRTPLYRSLQMDLDLDQSSSSSGENSGVRASMSAYATLLNIFATDKHQHLSLISAFLQPRYGSSKQGDIKNIDNGVGGGVRYARDDRRYKEKYFIETGGAAGGTISSRKNGIKGQATGQTDYHAYIELVGGIGRGRLEYVHDAQAAILILDDLYRSGIIKSKVDAETANRFAQLITNIKKQRVLDSRRRTIYKLTQVDSFLRVNKLITQCDARTMATINDVLFYSFQNDLSDNMNTFEDPVDFSFNRGDYDEGYENTDYAFIPQFEALSDQSFRQQGTVMYARLVPELRYNSFNTKIEKPTGDSNATSSYLHIAPGAQVGYEKHEAVSLKWQKNYGGSLRFAYIKYLVTKPNINPDYHLSQIAVNYELGYYPNSRSVIEGRAELEYSHYGGKGMKASFITPQLTLNAGYFLSYNTVVRASLFANYMIQAGSINESTLGQGLRIYLRHYFF